MIHFFPPFPPLSCDLCTAYIALRKYTVSGESWSFFANSTKTLPLLCDRWCDFDSNLDEKSWVEGGEESIDRNIGGKGGSLSVNFGERGDVIRILVIVEIFWEVISWLWFFTDWKYWNSNCWITWLLSKLKWKEL